MSNKKTISRWDPKPAQPRACPRAVARARAPGGPPRAWPARGRRRRRRGPSAAVAAAAAARRSPRRRPAPGRAPRPPPPPGRPRLHPPLAQPSSKSEFQWRPILAARLPSQAAKTMGHLPGEFVGCQLAIARRLQPVVHPMANISLASYQCNITGKMTDWSNGCFETKCPDDVGETNVILNQRCPCLRRTIGLHKVHTWSTPGETRKCTWKYEMHPNDWNMLKSHALVF